MSRASFGKLKLVLRLELPLLCRPDADARPILEKDVLRDEGDEPPPVAAVLLFEGDCVRTGDTGLAVLPFRSRAGISTVPFVNIAYKPIGRRKQHIPLSTVSVSAL